MKTTLKSIITAAFALAASFITGSALAAAPIGQQITFSNAGLGGGAGAASFDANVLSIIIPVSDDLPAGTVVRLNSITLGLNSYNDTLYPFMKVGDVFSDQTAKQTSAKFPSKAWKEQYNFSDEILLMVGVKYPINFYQAKDGAAQQSRFYNRDGDAGIAASAAVVVNSNANNYRPEQEVVVTVAPPNPLVTKMFSSKLATSGEAVPAGTYGGIEVPGFGYSATAYSSVTAITPETGSIEDLLIAPGWNYVGTHTISGWFKIASLPTSGDATIYGFSKAGGTCSYRVAVTPDGYLKVGKGNGQNVDSWDGGNRGGSVTTSVAVPVDEWFYLTIACKRNPEVASADSRAAITVFVNGEQKFTQADCFLCDGGGGSGKKFVIGSGVSAAGLYGDRTAVTDVNTIKNWATNEKLVEAAPEVSTATINGESNWSDLKWSKDPESVGLVKITVAGDSTLTIDKDVSVADLVFTGSGALTIKGEHILTANLFDIGSFTLASGTLSIPADNTLTSVTIEEGAVLTLDVSSAKILNKINGTGVLVKSGTAELGINGTVDDTTFKIENGSVTLNKSDTGATLTDVTFDMAGGSLGVYGWPTFNGTLTIVNENDVSILSKNFNGNAAIVKQGAGTLTFGAGTGNSGHSSYITAEAGTLVLTGGDSGKITVDALKAGAGTIQVQSGKTLEVLSELDLTTATAIPVNGDGALNLSSVATFKFPSSLNEGVPFTLCTSSLSVGATVLTDAAVYVGDELQEGAIISYDVQNKKVSYAFAPPPTAEIANETLTLTELETNAAFIEVEDGAQVIVNVNGDSTLQFDKKTRFGVINFVIADGAVLTLDSAMPPADMAKYNFVGGSVAYSWLDFSGKKVIAINFNKRGTDNNGGGGDDSRIVGDDEDSAALGMTLPGRGWLQTEAATSDWTSDAFVYDLANGSKGESVQVKWNSANVYRMNNMTSGKFLNGYLDDGGNRAQVSVQVPFEFYDVIIYQHGDSTANNPTTVNGNSYTYGEYGVAAKGTAVWGKHATLTPVWGDNAMVVKKQSGDLEIVGGANANGGRGPISAIVIVETEATVKDVDCGTAYAISDANEFTEDIINLRFADEGGALTVDELPERVFTFFSKGMITVKYTNGLSFSDDFLTKFDTVNVVGGIKYVFTDGTIPVTAPTKGVIYRWEGDMTFSTIPYAGSAHTGTIEIACPVTTVSGAAAETQAYMSGAKNLVVFDEGFELTTAERVSLGNGGGANQNYLQKGGTLELTSTAVASSCGATPLVLARYGVTVNYNLMAGELIAPNGTIQNWDGTFHYTIGGDETKSALFKAKGFSINRGGQSYFEVVTNGTLAIGANGITAGANQTFKLNGGTLQAYDTFSAGFGAGIQVLSDSTISVDSEKTLTITGSISGDGAIAKTGAGLLVLTQGRPMLGAIAAGKIRFVATADEIADGEIVVKTTEASYADGVFEVKNADGYDVEIKSINIQSGVLTINLPKNLIEASSKVSDWDEMVGEVAIKATNLEELVTITVDQAFSADIAAINVFGNVKFVFEDGATASDAIIKPVAGSTVTITGPLQNQISPASGSTVVIDGEVTLNKNISMVGGASLTVNPGATLTFGMANPFNANANNRTVGTYNIYGTVDLGTYDWLYESNSNSCTFNFYAGSTITGTTGKFNRGGGSGTSYNLKAYADAVSNYVTFDVARANSYDNADIGLNVEEGVGYKQLKHCPNKTILNGTGAGGVELGASVGTVKVAATGSLGGKVIVGAGSTLELGAENVFVTDGDTPAELAIAGTLNCNNHEQNLSVLNITNNMTIANGNFPNATVTVKGGVVLTTTGSALSAANIVVNGAVNGAVKVTGTLSGSGSVTTATLADGAYLDATAGTLTISTLQTEGDKIVIRCKASGGALVKGLTDDPSANVKLIDPSGAEIPLRKGRFKFKDGELSFMFNAFLLMLK